MELKKNPRHDLERKRKKLFVIGLVAALGVTLVAFEWTTFYEIKDELPGDDIAFFEEDEKIPIVIIKEKQEEIKPKKPKAANNTINTEPVKITITDTAVTTDPKLPELGSLGLTNVNFKIDVQPIDPFIPVQQPPGFPGGEKALFKYLDRNLKYPRIPLEEGTSGTVYVEFIVSTSGKLTKIKVAKGVDPYLDAEAVRIVRRMPKWIPGKQIDQVVPAGLRLPISFTIRQ